MTIRTQYATSEIEKMRTVALEELHRRFDEDVKQLGKEAIEARNHATQFGRRLHNDKVLKFGIKEINVGEDAPPGEVPGFSVEHLVINGSNDCFLTKYDLDGVRLIAKGWTSALFHAFLLQYRQPGAVLPRVQGEVAIQRPHGGEVVERDMTWALQLLLEPVPTREALLERLREADAARLAAWGDERYLPESYTTEICFETACYQRYLKFPGHPDSPLEAPVATHQEIVAWLHNGGRIRTPTPGPIREARCNYCLIDRKDGSWSIYGWDGSDGPDRYPPEEVIRYYDEAMAHEYLLNAALQAIV